MMTGILGAEMVTFDIATLGTSLTANTASYVKSAWQSTLELELMKGKKSKVRTYNFGFGGVTSSFAATQIPRLLPLRPKVVTIEYNMNDCALSNSISTAQSQANHINIINAIQAALPDTLIFLMTMNPPIGAAVSGRPNIEGYNNVYRALAASIEGVNIIDTAPSWAGATTALIPDNIHPNLAAWTSKLVPAMTTALAPLID